MYSFEFKIDSLRWPPSRITLDIFQILKFSDVEFMKKITETIFC